MINPRTDEAYQLLHDGILALSRAEQTGICIDIDYVQRKKAHLSRKIERLEDEFKSSNFFKAWQYASKSKVNINSHIQLAYYLYNVKKIEPAKLTPSGKGSTDEESLKQLNIPEVNLLLEKNKLMKIRDTYLDGFEKEAVNGIVHTNFNLHLPVSFRSSCSNPNFQNIPIRDEEAMQICRSAIYPRKGHQFLEIDFKSIEVGINACYNKDTNLIKYVSDPSTDMHRDMATQIFKLDEFDKSIPEHYLLRQAAKNGFVFPQFYGDYYKNCADNLATNWGKLPQKRWKEGEGVPMPSGTLSDHLIGKGIKSYDNFTNHLKVIEKDFWGSRFPEYADWKEMWWDMYKKYGYIDLLTGFRCQGLMDRKQVCNYPGQGSAFHCLLWSLIQTDMLQTKRKWDSKIVLQVHDSLIMDTNPDELSYVTEAIYNITTKKLPEFWKWIIVPLSIDMELAGIDEPWSEKKKYIPNLH